MKQLSSAQVRQMWLDFWATKGHSVEPSVSLVPVNDPTLLWINSGVATLKKYFDGTIIPENPRITNAQKAIRTNDIENVGKTARHHTMFGDGRLMLILAQTFFLAFLSALIATIIGTFGAIYIYQSRKKYQEAFLSLNNILMVAPDVMIGASFLILFTQLKFSLGFLTVLSSHVAFSIPIVVLMVLPRLKEMNGDMIHAAYDLGASQFQMFKEIMLPYLTPSIITGYFMAFTYSLDDFAVTFFVTGNGFSTLSVEIYSRARKGISLEINALSALVFLFSIILVVGYYFISREKEEQA
ncbi:spermidine/putrescine ABC transporter permease [Streptococcus pneumoniae]|nr:spermidine/putrescine ABC transporter permease [Streptococcus pneumoniae]